jgi:hypothetical protein
MLDEVQPIAQQLNLGSHSNELEMGGSEMLAWQRLRSHHQGEIGKPTSVQQMKAFVCDSSNGVQPRPAHASGPRTPQAGTRPKARAGAGQEARQGSRQHNVC